METLGRCLETFKGRGVETHWEGVETFKGRGVETLKRKGSGDT